jgi:XTP/dITP diphosphohydrolase
MAVRRVVLASGNAGKLREFQALLAPTGIELVPQSQLGVADADEPHVTFVENALAKARHASAATGLAALADDSGICVPALGGAPGVRSARYAGDGARGLTREQIDAANNARLVADLQGLPDWSAYYYCALVLVRAPQDPQPLIADGLWYGRVIATPRGAGGFGYDPHLLLPERGLTVAELDPQEKNRISHRGQALAALLARLTQARLAA